MDVHWTSFGRPLGVHWTSFGRPLDVHWTSIGRPLDGRPLDVAALTTIASIAMQGVRQADLRVGEVAIVVGLGLVGQMTARILVASGVRVLCVDLNEKAVKLAKSQGLKVFNGDEKKQLLDAMMQATHGQGADGILICAATKSSEPVVEAVAVWR